MTRAILLAAALTALPATALGWHQSGPWVSSTPPPIVLQAWDVCIHRPHHHPPRWCRQDVTVTYHARRRLIPPAHYARMTASAYSPADSGRYTASGKRLTWASMFVASRDLPMHTLVRVCWHARCAAARVEDRGPWVAGRDLDLAPGVYKALGAATPEAWGVRRVTVTW